MKRSPDTSQVVYRREYEQELETWLHRRFGYLCITYIVLGVAELAARLLAGSQSLGAVTLLIATSVLSLMIIAYCYRYRRQLETRAALLGAVSRMILALGAISLLSAFTHSLIADNSRNIVAAIFIWHFTACLYLPWKPIESIRPILPLLVVWAVLTLIFSEVSWFARILMVAFSPGILIPGLVICSWRLRAHSRQFRATMLGRHFRTMRQEFTKARGIHEGMFPAEYDDGHARFQYTYQPMRELGGDFIHLHVTPQGWIHLTVLDVTGHGLAAALTVNRIYGEIERIRAESPTVQPAEVLTLLNRYINLTMTRHNIYVTAMSVSLDPYLGEAHWANAGHPPAFLRGANGVVRHLAATGVVLGALTDDEFTIEQETIELTPGDVIVAYTDGAFEARDRRGQQFGLDSLRQLLHRTPPPNNWPQFICSLVDKHLAGRSEDDVLVASLTFTGPRAATQPKTAEALAT